MALGSEGETRILTGFLTGTMYISLHTGDPGDTGANEVSGGAYARESMAFSQSGSNPTTASNTGVVQFTQATASWGTITHFGVWDAVSAGNFLGGSALDESKVVAIGDIVRWEIGALDITAD